MSHLSFMFNKQICFNTPKMSRLFINAIISSLAYTFIPGFTLAQEVPSLPESNKFVDRIEIIIGLGLHLPDDNGWSDYIRDNTNGSSYEIFNKMGYSAGIGFIHSFNQEFEIRGRCLMERKGYKEKDILSGSNIREFEYNTINDYVTLSLTPLYSFGKSNFHIFLGAFFSRLTKTITTVNEYTNGQRVAMSRIITDVNENEIGLIGGFGYPFKINRRIQIELQIQGNYGLTDIVDQNGFKLNNNSLLLNISIQYNR